MKKQDQFHTIPGPGRNRSAIGKTAPIWCAPPDRDRSPAAHPASPGAAMPVSVPNADVPSGTTENDEENAE